MERNESHSQSREPFTEYFLANLRYKRVIEGIPDGSSVLDLGCGFEGKFLEGISSKIKNGIGLDLSVKDNSIKSNIELKKYELNKKLPFPDESFDVVTSLAVVEHLSDCENHFLESFRVLRKGGVLLLTTPAPRSKRVLEFLARLGFVSKEEIYDHKRYLSLKDLEDLSKMAGFSEINKANFQFGFNNFLIAKK
jgi:ubiquinone/menaquinone biosynthesis C-methylase UbiE